MSESSGDNLATIKRGSIENRNVRPLNSLLLPTRRHFPEAGEISKIFIVQFLFLISGFNLKYHKEITQILCQNRNNLYNPFVNNEI